MRLLSDISEDLFGQFVKSIQPTALNAQPVGLSETQAASFLSFKPDILLSTPTTTGGNDNIDAGFLTMSINGGDGMDHLTLDYSGADADGNVATSVRLILNSTSTSSSNTELVYFTTAQGN